MRLPGKALILELAKELHPAEAGNEPAAAAPADAVLAELGIVATPQPPLITARATAELASVVTTRLRPGVPDVVVLGMYFADHHMEGHVPVPLEARTFNLRVLRHVPGVVFAAPLHTMPMERAFSSVGNIWSNVRNRLESGSAGHHEVDVSRPRIQGCGPAGP